MDNQPVFAIFRQQARNAHGGQYLINRAAHIALARKDVFDVD
jgi:hypothetical protein